MLDGGCVPCGMGGAQPPPFYPSAIAASPYSYLSGLGATGSQRDYTPDVVGGIAGFTVPFLYTKYRKKKWPKANLFGQLAMLGGTYFAVRWSFTQMQKPSTL